MTNVSASAPRHRILIPEETVARAGEYLATLRATALAGRFLANRLEGSDLAAITPEAFLGELVETKKPCIFAESGVYGDGSDWNLTELGLLGDISVAVPVTIFDDGKHQNPSIHRPPFAGTLVYTPGALLAKGAGNVAADLDAVLSADGTICDEGYYALYCRRLLPVFEYVNTHAGRPRSAFLTIPGLGCGQFAGKFRGTLGAKLEWVLERFLREHGEAFPNIKAVYFDPYDECSNARHEIHGLSFMVRPFTKRAGGGKAQLCRPAEYSEAGDDFSECQLYSVVAWDHVSWPGNDFYAGARATDDGVKAAATSSMEVLTGVAGNYAEQKAKYQPPNAYRTWEEVVENGRLTRDLRLWNSAAVWRQGSGVTPLEYCPSTG